jgi:hypothetical protein
MIVEEKKIMHIDLANILQAVAAELSSKYKNNIICKEVDTLNALAEARSKQTGVNFYKAYDAILRTAEGKLLYRAILEAPMPHVIEEK